MLGSWLSSIVHKAAPVIGVATTVVTGNPAAGAAAYAATAKKPSAQQPVIVVAPPTTQTNPQGELILLGLAGLGIFFLARPKASKP